jgi:hypothetical protein
MVEYITNSEIVKRFGVSPPAASRIGRRCKSRVRDDKKIEYLLTDVQKIIDKRSKEITEIPANCLIMTQITKEFNYARETIRKFQKKGIFPQHHGVAFIGTVRLKTYFFLRKKVAKFFKDYEKSLGLDCIPEGHINRDGICRHYKMAWATLQLFSQKKDFPSPAGKYKTKSNLSCDYFSIAELDGFFIKHGKSRVEVIETKKPSVIKKPEYLSERGQMTRLRSGAIVPRRIIRAPDLQGLLW